MKTKAMLALFFLMVILMAAFRFSGKDSGAEMLVQAEIVSSENTVNASSAPVKSAWKTPKQIYKEALLYTVAVVSEWEDPADTQNPRYPKKSSFCTGFVRTANEKHYIYTVRHCFDDYPDLKNFKVWIEFSDNEIKEAEIVGYNQVPLDLALLKFKDANFVPKASAKIGNSDTLEVGDQVVAVGHPFGIKNYLSTGRVGRLQLTEIAYYSGPGLIGTETHLGPGNSGGPLFNMKGEVIGLNEAVKGDMIFPAISLIIPINQMEAIFSNLLNGGEVQTANLGYHIEDSWKLNPLILKELGLERTKIKRPVVLGPKIASPLDLPKLWPFSTLREGDIIIQYNKKPVNNRSEIDMENLTLKPGTKVELVILRNGKRLAKEVKLEDLKLIFGTENLKILKGMWRKALIQKK